MKKTRIAALLFALCLGAVAMAGCGDEKSNKKAEKTEEKKTEQTVENSDENTDETAEEADAKDSDEEEEDKLSLSDKLGYFPSKEIKEANFASGLVQIGDRTFRIGGFNTVNEFIEEFGDVYDMSELDVNAAVDVSSDDTYTLTATNDAMPSRLELDFNRVSGDTVGECIVESIKVCNRDIVKAEKNGELDSFNFWAPYGIKLHPDDLTTSDIEEICKAEGLKEYITGSGEKHFYNCYFINSFNDLEIEVVSKEKCKNGYYPVITYRFKCKSKYNKDENVLYLSSCACGEYLTEEEAAEYNK